jgi:two-component system, LytTR family, response regulator
LSLKLNTLVADDERFARERLVKLLSDYDIFSVNHIAEDGDQVRKILENENIDTAFLDINMPGESVFNILEKISPVPVIVFQTAYSEFAVKAFQINAVDYLLKPIDRELLAKTAERIKKAVSQNTPLPSRVSHIPVRSGNEIKLIPFKSINSIISKDGYSYINSEGKTYISEKALNYYEEILDENEFYRISRSDIISIKKIDKVLQTKQSNYEVLLKDGTKHTLSRRRAADLNKKLKVK